MSSNLLGDVWPMGFAAAHAVLAGIWITPLLILWFVSLCVVRRRGDPARVGVAWIKAIYPFWILSMICQVVQVGLNIWVIADVHARFTDGLGPAIGHLFFAARTLQNTSDILLFITFVELGSGFVFCLKGGKKTTIRRYTRYAAFSWAIVLLTLAIALLAMCTEAETYIASKMAELESFVGQSWVSSKDIERWQRYHDYMESTYQAHLDRLTKTGRLHNTLNICLWITSFPALCFASYVLHKSKENIMLKKAATLYLVSTVLTFCRLFATMAIYVNEYNSYAFLGLRQDIAYTDILTPILPTIEAFFNFVLMFIVLALLFIIAIRKRRGLWSTSQMTWDVSNKLANVTTGPSPTSETPCYSDDGLQEHGFCLQPQQAEPTSVSINLQSTNQPQSPAAVALPPALPQREVAAIQQNSQPASPRRQHTIPRRPLATSVPHSPIEPISPTNTIPSSQGAHQHDGEFLTRQRTIEELDAQKVLILEGSRTHYPRRTTLEDEVEVADGFQVQGHQHLGLGQSSSPVVAAKIQRTQDHDPTPEESTQLNTVADGFQMQNSENFPQRREDDRTTAKMQKLRGHEESVTESDAVADGFQMQSPGSSEPPSYAEAGGDTTATRMRLGYLREKDDQDKKARGRARSF